MTFKPFFNSFYFNRRFEKLPVINVYVTFETKTQQIQNASLYRISNANREARNKEKSVYIVQ